MRALRAIVLLAAAVALTGCAAGVTPLAHTHAHNDYQHPRPLLDALDHGFTSVEADIHLVNGKLLVGHDRADLTPRHTLEALYLDPLRQRVQANGGRVYRGGPTVLLLIDVKTPADATYAALAPVLERYAAMLTKVVHGRVTPGAVTVILSGNRPALATLGAAPVRYAAYDGRLTDLDSDAPPDLMPLISDNWTTHFNWRGQGALPEAERWKLQSLVRQAHAHGRLLRFWGTPDDPEVWRELLAAGVDLLNADDLAGLQGFLLAQGPSSPHAFADRAAN